MKKRTKKRIKPVKKAGKVEFPTELEVDVFASASCCGCPGCQCEDPCPENYPPCDDNQCPDYEEPS